MYSGCVQDVFRMHSGRLINCYNSNCIFEIGKILKFSRFLRKSRADLKGKLSKFLINFADMK